MSDKIHYCDVCGISSEEKRVNFIKNANMYLCRKHREQFMKFGEFKDSNKRGVFDPNEVRILKDYAEIDTYDSFGGVFKTYKIDLDDIVAKNQAKMKKKREKMGISDETMRRAGTVNTRNINNSMSEKKKEEKLKEAEEKKRNVKPTSMAAKANMVRDFNEGNKK